MKTLYSKKSTESVVGKCNILLTAYISLFLFSLAALFTPASAQAVLFDFDNAALHSSLPINQTAGGITAYLSATGQGYSIQDANVLGFTPPGFAGNIIYPNSIYIADLLIRYDQRVTEFSIMYSCQELACDDAATMRVTAYLNGSFIGTSTKTASFPGTWPVDTLRCNFPQSFDSVIVHYDSHPPTCQDYGVIFMADNMRVTPFNTASIFSPETFIERLIIPNPISHSATFSFSLFHFENIQVTIYDISGRLVKNLFNGLFNAGEHQLNWDVTDGTVEDGVYILNLNGERFSRSYKLVVVK